MADIESLTGVFLSLRQSLLRYVTGIVPPREVEDIVQETYVRVCQMQIATGGIRAPGSYLYRTARNLALDYVKCSESRLAADVPDTAEHEFGAVDRLADGTFDQAASHEEFALFCEAVRELPAQCRQAFVLRKVYGYSQREIAEKMGLSESTIEKHIALGIRRCISFMQHRAPRIEEMTARNRRRPVRMAGRRRAS